MTCLGQFVYNRVPFEGGQDFRHLVGDVVNRLHQEVTAAHGWVEHLQIEEGLVEGLAEFLVGLVFGADIFTSQCFGLVTLYLQRLLGLAEDGTQRF